MRSTNGFDISNVVIKSDIKQDFERQEPVLNDCAKSEPERLIYNSVY